VILGKDARPQEQRKERQLMPHSRTFWKNVSLCIRVLFAKLQIVSRLFILLIYLHTYMLNANPFLLYVGMQGFLSHW
jgi:hypothetical protein